MNRCKRLPPSLAFIAFGLLACGDDTPAVDTGTLEPDAGTRLDAATPDTGTADAGGFEDASEPTDMGARDTGTDAGSPPALQPIEIALSTTGHDRLLGVTHDSTGRSYVTGVVSDSTTAPDYEMVLARLLDNGQLDPSFGTNGMTRINVVAAGTGEVARGIVVQSDGKIVISGTVEDLEASDPRDRNIALLRFNDDGTLDDQFANEGIAVFDFGPGAEEGTGYTADSTWGLGVYSDDDLLIVGSKKADERTDADFFAARVSANGELDEGFATNGVFSLDIGNNGASPRSATILPDDSAVMAGYMSADGVVQPVLYKLTAVGALDPTFGVGGVYTEAVLGAVTEAYGAARQGTSFVTAGYGRDGANDDLDWVSLRITEDGTRDLTYGQNGVATFDLAGNNDNARSLMVLPDGRILLLGGGRPTTDNVDAMLVMLTAEGAIDTSFGQEGRMSFDFGGTSDFFWGASISPDGAQVLLAGTKQVAASGGDDDDGVVLMLPLE